MTEEKQSPDVIGSQTISGSSSTTESALAAEIDRKSQNSSITNDLSYGCCGTRPSWLQWMNNIVGAVIFICLANLWQGFANGLFGSAVSTLEKRFDMSSSQSSLIASGYEVGPIPVIIVLMILGKRVHRPISMAIGLLCVALGCVVFFIPQFTTPPYKPPGGNLPTQTCRVPESNSTFGCDLAGSDSGQSLSYYIPVFLIARLLIGFGSTPILTLGVNYIDDCSTREQFAIYFAVYVSMTIIAPTLGAIICSACLSLFTDFYLISGTDLGIEPKDQRWIGAWWLPYTFAAGLCLLTAIPLWGYPHELRGAAELRANRLNETHTVDSKKRRQSILSSGRGVNPTLSAMCRIFISRCKSVLTNPTYLAMTVFFTCDKLVTAVVASYGPKYFQVTLYLTPSVAGLAFAAVLLPSGVAGSVIGGVLINKLRLTCQQLIKLQFGVAFLLCLSGSAMYLLPCPTAQMAGVTKSYNSSASADFDITLNNACNANCSCDASVYQPVCSYDSVQYFSSCYAGCQFEDDVSTPKSKFYNCSCLTPPSQIDITEPDATGGECRYSICTKGIIFLVVHFFTALFLNITNVTSVAITLRCVKGSETTVAIGVQILLSKLLGTIPGPLLIGFAFDAACILWQPLLCDKSDSQGSCLLYDNEKLALSFLIFLVSIKAVSLVAMIVALFSYRQPPTVPGETLEVWVTAASSADKEVNGVEQSPTGDDQTISSACSTSESTLVCPASTERADFSRPARTDVGTEVPTVVPEKAVGTQLLDIVPVNGVHEQPLSNHGFLDEGSLEISML